ncbi:MAG: YccF domain-containing protein [Candidatus Nanopelagicales bacterium]
MRTLGNILWLIFAGIWMAIAYAIAGVIMFILIITIPFGIASFRMAGYALWPFGRTVVSKPTSGVMSGIGNVIWFILAGLWIAIGHIITGVVLCIFIITIPFGIASFKMAGLALFPLGKEIVPIDQAPTGQYTVTPIGK